MERDLVHDILEKWGAHPRLRLARVNVGAVKVRDRLVRFGVPGCADICGVLGPGGRFVAIECKSATGRQRPEQQSFERVIRSLGGVYILARSLADVDRALAALGVR